jgi:O-antigen/teichoic acid export membrane protein
MSKIVVLITGLGLEVCLAWFLKPEGRGSYAVSLTFCMLLQILFLTGWNVASIYFVASKQLTLSEVITQTFVYGVISSSMAVVTGILLMNLPLAFFDAADKTSFHMALVLIPSTFFAIVFLRLLTAMHEFRWFAVISILNGVSFLLLALIFVGVTSLGVHGALLACILRHWLVITVTLIFFYRKYNIKIVKPSLVKMKRVFLYGLRYHVGQIANNVNAHVGTMILAMFATKVEVGFMAVAVQLMCRGVMTIPDTIMTVLLPKASEDKIGHPQLIARCARLTGLTCAVLILILIVFAKPIVKLMFSPSFMPVVSLIRILAVGTFVRCTCKVFTSYLQGTNHPGIESIAVAIGVIVNFVILWLLLPVMGLPAAALAITFSYLISSAIMTLGFLKFSRFNPRETFCLTRSDLTVMYNAITRFFLQYSRKQVFSSRFAAREDFLNSPTDKN